MQITDEKLYELCQTYGERTRFWRQKFAGLLPEVARRQLQKKKGFGSIYEFAAKLAGMSERQVDTALHTDKKFEATPILKGMLDNGEVSLNKLARVASVVTPENQEFWATQVKILPQSALETLVRDEKNAAASAAIAALQENNFDEQLMRAHHGSRKSPILQELNISAEVSKKLLELQQKGIDVNALLTEFLEKRELDIARRKEKLSAAAKPTDSTYINVATRKLLTEEDGEKCSIKTCTNPAEHIHHTQRRSLSHNHDPKFLAPLCKDHHIIAHSIDLKYHRARESSW